MVWGPWRIVRLFARRGRGRGAYPSALSAVEYWLCGKRAPGEGMERGVNTIIVRSTIYIHRRMRIVLFRGAFASTLNDTWKREIKRLYPLNLFLCYDL